MISELAERASAAVMRSLAAYRAGLGRLAGVGSGGRLGDRGAWDADEQQVIADIVSEMEVFTDTRLELAAGAVSLPTTWVQRRKAWAKLGIELTAYSGWPALNGFIDARNAILHRRGRLTRKQLQTSADRAATVNSLARAGIGLRDDQLVLGPTQVELASGIVRDYVSWLDRQAPDRSSPG